MPGIYAVTSTPFDSRTRAIFRSAEFGFFGVVVVTFTQTPRLNGLPFFKYRLRRRNVLSDDCKAGVFDFDFDFLRDFLSS